MTSRRQNHSRHEKTPPRDTGADSGSTGRRAGTGEPESTQADKPGNSGNTGQDKYGQSGFGQGGYGQDKNGQPPHKGEEAGSSGTSDYGNSNFGSGRAERDETQKKVPDDEPRNRPKRERP